jgi:hypothetical protein
MSFDPGQPRDSHGRWTAGASGSRVDRRGLS